MSDFFKKLFTGSENRATENEDTHDEGKFCFYAHYTFPLVKYIFFLLWMRSLRIVKTSHDCCLCALFQLISLIPYDIFADLGSSCCYLFYHFLFFSIY